MPPRNLWEQAGEDSLEGRYFQLLQERLSAPKARSRRPSVWPPASAAKFWTGRR